MVKISAETNVKCVTLKVKMTQWIPGKFWKQCSKHANDVCYLLDFLSAKKTGKDRQEGWMNISESIGKQGHLTEPGKQLLTIKHRNRRSKWSNERLTWILASGKIFLVMNTT